MTLVTAPPVAALLSVLAVCAVFGASVGNDFVWDDVIVIQRDPLLRTLSSIPRLFTLPYLTLEAGLYRPLAPVTWCLNFVFGGESPVGFHLVNLLLHAANAWLVFLLAKRLGAERWCAWWAGVWFLVLPIHTEAVVPIVGRSDLLATLWSLVTLLALLRAERVSRVSGWRCAGIGSAFLLALLSKEHAIGLLPLYLWWVLAQARAQRWSLGWAVWEARRQLLWLTLALALYAALRAIVLGPFTITGDTAVTIVENPLAFLPALQRYATALAIVSLYALKSLMPLTLSSDYGYNQIPAAASFLDVRALAGLAILGWLAWVMLRAPTRPARGWMLWRVAAAIVLVFFLPVSNLPVLIGTSMGERLMYLPSVGLCLMLGMLTVRVTSWRAPWGTAGWLVALSFLGFYGWRSAARTLEWRSEQALLDSAARASPNSVRVRTEQATRWLVQGDDKRAERELLDVLRLCPVYFHAVHNLGLVYQAQQRPIEAEQQFWRALQLVPRETRVYQNLALLYVDQGRDEEAAEALRFCYGANPALVKTALRRMFERHIQEAREQQRMYQAWRWQTRANRLLEKVPSLLYSTASWPRSAD